MKKESHLKKDLRDILMKWSLLILYNKGFGRFFHCGHSRMFLVLVYDERKSSGIEIGTLMPYIGDFRPWCDFLSLFVLFIIVLDVICLMYYFLQCKPLPGFRKEDLCSFHVLFVTLITNFLCIYYMYSRIQLLWI